MVIVDRQTQSTIFLNNYNYEAIVNMRQKRAKAYRKLMHLYSLSFGFRKPYQVLCE